MTVTELGDLLKKGGFQVPDIFTKEGSERLSGLCNAINTKIFDDVRKILEPYDTPEFNELQKSIQESIFGKLGI